MKLTVHMFEAAGKNYKAQAPAEEDEEEVIAITRILFEAAINIAGH